MMFATLIVTLSLIGETGQTLPIAEFDTAAECSDFLLHMIYDAQCTSDTETSPPRPRPRPTKETE